MGSRIVFVNGSPRPHGGTSAALAELQAGNEEAGAHALVPRLYSKEQGMQWIRHSIQETGRLCDVAPVLFANQDKVCFDPEFIKFDSMACSEGEEAGMAELGLRQRATRLWLSLWLYAMVPVAGILIGLTAANWNAWDVQTKLVALSTAMPSIHVLEEWRFPGGFHCMYNEMAGSEMPDRYPMNQLSDMWTNTIGTIVGCLMLAIGVNPMFALMQCLQGAGEIIAHTSAGSWALRRWRPQGKRTIYNPGLATSWLGYFPLVCAFIWSFATYAAPTMGEVIGALVLGALLMAISLPLMERICKSERTPYANDWRDGYFQKFAC